MAISRPAYLQIPALIPLLDLANHEFSAENMPDSVHFSIDTDSASITALQAGQGEMGLSP